MEIADIADRLRIFIGENIKKRYDKSDKFYLSIKYVKINIH